jgi:hypothetical protein
MTMIFLDLTKLELTPTPPKHPTLLAKSLSSRIQTRPGPYQAPSRPLPVTSLVIVNHE